MAELDYTNIASTSIATPAAGVTATFVDSTTSPTKRLKTRDDAGLLVSYVGISTTDTAANRLQNKDLEAATTNIVDATDTTKKIAWANSAASTATVLTLTGQQATSQSLSFPVIRQAETIAVKPQVATTLSTPLNPTGTASTTGVQMGLAQAITPQVTGRILVTICGVVANNTTADGATWQIKVGTGGAPANGAALTGTAYGSLQSMTFLTGVLKVPFSVTALVTGLAVGTAAWVDISLAAVTGGTATMTSVACSVTEL